MYGATFTLHTDGSCLAEAAVTDAGLTLVVKGTQVTVDVMVLITGTWLLAGVTDLLAVNGTVSKLAEVRVTGKVAAPAELMVLTTPELCTSVAQTTGLLTSCKFCSTGKMLP